MSEAAQVLVADDHPLFRTALAELFQRDAAFSLIGAVADLPAALALLDRHRCDLAILDVHMPGMDGRAGAAAIHARWPGTKIALISGEIDAATVAAGMKAGVSGFLPKSFDPDVILAAVKLVLAGGTYVPHDVRLGEQEPPPMPGTGAPASLSAREREMLGLMARGATHKEIGRTLGLAEVTVKLYTQRIVRKLDVKNRSAAIAKAVKEGMIEPP